MKEKSLLLHHRGSGPDRPGLSELISRQKINLKFYFFSSTAQQPLVSQGIFILYVSRSLSDTPHLVGLLWTSDQPVPETST
jgi:hypothetical protein